MKPVQLTLGRASEAAEAFRQRLAQLRVDLTRMGVDMDRVDGQIATVDDGRDAAPPDFIRTFMSVYDGLGDRRDWSVGASLFLTVYVVNRLALGLLSAILGPVAGRIAMAVLVAPFVEERARREAIRRGHGLSSFTAIVNGYEFTTGVGALVGSGASVGAAVTIRTFVVVLHQLLGALQKWGVARDLELGVDPAEAGKREYRAAIVIHTLYNFLGGGIWQAVFPRSLGENVTLQPNAAFESDNMLHENIDIDIIISCEPAPLHEGWFRQWFTGADDETREKLTRLKSQIRTEKEREEALDAIETVSDNSNRVFTFSNWKDFATSVGFNLVPVFGQIVQFSRVIMRAAGERDRQKFRQAMMDLHAEIKNMKLKE